MQNMPIFQSLKRISRLHVVCGGKHTIGGMWDFFWCSDDQALKYSTIYTYRNTIYVTYKSNANVQGRYRST